MSEELVVRHCSPTLAGMKTANMYTCAYASEEEMREHVRQLNRTFGDKGLRAIPLRYRGGKALIYVFRPERLKEDLCDCTACSVLKERGYPCEKPICCLGQLVQRVQSGSDVPHEIGFFLGYPPEDVTGFMENRTPCNCPGPWKVYGDVDAARARFDRYKKCTEIYCNQWAKGRKLEHLVVKS